MRLNLAFLEREKTARRRVLEATAKPRRAERVTDLAHVTLNLT